MIFLKRRYYHKPIALILIYALMLLTFPISGCGEGREGSDTGETINPPTPNPTSTVSPTPNPTTNPTFSPIPNPTSTSIPTPTVTPEPDEILVKLPNEQVYSLSGAENYFYSNKLDTELKIEFLIGENLRNKSGEQIEKITVDATEMRVFQVKGKTILGKKAEIYINDDESTKEILYGGYYHNGTEYRWIWYNETYDKTADVSINDCIKNFQNCKIKHLSYRSDNFDKLVKLLGVGAVVLIIIPLLRHIMLPHEVFFGPYYFPAGEAVKAAESDQTLHNDWNPTPSNPPDGTNPSPQNNNDTSPGNGNWQSATTLWQYYYACDKSLPSKSMRAQFYEMLGLGSANSYYGSIEQNTRLLNVLKEKGISPLTVEELENIIGPTPIPQPSPPPPEPGVEDTHRTSWKSWSFVSHNNHLYAVHVGQYDGKIYLGKRDPSGNWSNWKSLPDAYTEQPVSITYWKGRLIVAFTGGDGKIWVANMNLDASDFNGNWHFTKRYSTHGPVLASDGSKVYLIHKGSGNDRIYFSGNAPNFDNDWNDSYRDTQVRPSAAVWNGNLYICHKGAHNTRIYYKKITGDNSPYNWIDTGRDTQSQPSILIVNGEVYIAHQGANNLANYIGRPLINKWISLKEKTSTAPFIKDLGNEIFYGYVYGNNMRLQKIKPNF